LRRRGVNREAMVVKVKGSKVRHTEASEGVDEDAPFQGYSTSI